MKKILLLILLICNTCFIYGCNKDSKEDMPVSIYSVDINSLSNKKILSIINNENLEEGVYQIITTNNNYIFFKGIKNEYTNVSLALDNKALIIKCDTIPSSENISKLYLIKEKNITSSNDKNNFFDTIILKINNKESYFNSINKI